MRLWRIQKHVRRGQPLGFIIRLLPIVFVGLLVDGFGQMIGYAAGAGNSIEKVAKYEFHRSNNTEPIEQETPNLYS